MSSWKSVDYWGEWARKGIVKEGKEGEVYKKKKKKTKKKKKGADGSQRALTLRGTGKDTTSTWPLGVSLNMRAISHSPTFRDRFGKKQTPR